MKYWLFLGGLLLWGITATAKLIGPFPDGRFLGPGTWQDDAGNSGVYESYYTFKNNNLRADSAWKLGTRTLDLSFVFSSAGIFAIYQNGNAVGNGTCTTYSCQMNFTIDSSIYSNNLYFMPGLCINIGSGVFNGKNIYWQDSLQQLQP